eukprot:2766556-Prymnesium_polylepis.1
MFIPQRPRESVENYSKRCDGIRLTRYTFDWRAAHREIARASQSMAPQAAHLGAPRPGRVGARRTYGFSGQLAGSERAWAREHGLFGRPAERPAARAAGPLTGGSISSSIRQ